ncbi:MAG: glycosyltransferase, partial [Candidatus Eremiobacteraeota bacterium]|nr:glycosyltransferase [Candidatus Eremiobacteraeota bacterium]
RERSGIFNAAWICRPEIALRFGRLLRRQNCAIWYDTVDLHFLRLKRQEAVTGKPTNWRRLEAIEIGLAKSADATVVTSPTERDLLRDHGVERIHVIAPVQPAVNYVRPWSGRAGILFVGNYTHAPNVDAALRLAREVFPLIARQVPGIRLMLAGNEPPPEILALRGAGVVVTGWVPELTPFLEQARVFVAPLRFGSGIKGKLLQSMAHGLPIVTTAIGAEGIAIKDGANALVAETVQALARHAAQLYVDEHLWSTMSRAALDLVAQYRPEIVHEQLKALVYSGGRQASAAQAAK